MTRSEPIFNIPTRVETTRSEPTRIETIHEPNVTSDPDPPPSDSSDSSSSDSEKKGRNVKIRKSVVRIYKMTRQTRPRVMTLMTLIHLRTFVIDVYDTITRNMGKRIRSDYAQL